MQRAVLWTPHDNTRVARVAVQVNLDRQCAGDVHNMRHVHAHAKLTVIILAHGDALMAFGGPAHANMIAAMS